MHILELLHKTFEEKLPTVHKVRLKSLMTVCKAAIHESKLTLTGLGRAILNTNKECSNIQKVDRLLGNGHLQSERELFYKEMLSQIIKDMKHPYIHVDWTCINAVTNLYVLRASVSMKGRSIVVYEESHPKKNENKQSIHKAFLNQLKRLLPPSVVPIIVTDAGFRAPWFAYLIELGWDFVGRVRNKNLVLLEKSSGWRLSASYYEQATGIPTFLGQGLLTEENEVPVHFVLYKEKNKGRHKLNKNKKNCRTGKSKKHAKANIEPWLLVTSLTHSQDTPVVITNIYRQRMRIEEHIRDTKCPFYGIGFKKSLTKTAQRMNILLLIAAVVTFAAWLAGLFSKFIGTATDFQVHSAKFTSALSTVFLGRRVLKKGLTLYQHGFELALTLLFQLAIQTQQEAYHFG